VEAEAATNDILSSFDEIIRGLAPEDFWEFLKDMKVPIIRKMPESVIKSLVVKLRDPDVDIYARESVSSCRSKVSKIHKLHRDFVISSLDTLSEFERKELAKRLDPTLVPRKERTWGRSGFSRGGGGGGC
jgi:hypothetical protein